jgi:glycosyltransferase involved in cell wall biosynthesis
MNPEISVVMAVYNGGDFLKKSISSILGQTFKNFELIIVNDGSTDGSLNIISTFSNNDDRIVVINNIKNQGLTKSLNLGCKKAKGEYIARQDADDISIETRLDEQLSFMSNAHDIVLLGSRVNEINGKHKVLGRYFNEEEIVKRIKLQNPLIHSSVLIKAKVFKSIGFYNESYRTSQDFDAWIRLSKIGKICMLNRPLVNYYINENSISNKTKYKQCFNSVKIRWNHISYLGYKNFITGSIYRCALTCMPKFIIRIKQKTMGRGW